VCSHVKIYDDVPEGMASFHWRNEKLGEGGGKQTFGDRGGMGGVRVAVIVKTQSTSQSSSSLPEQSNINIILTTTITTAINITFKIIKSLSFKSYPSTSSSQSQSSS